MTCRLSMVSGQRCHITIRNCHITIRNFVLGSRNLSLRNGLDLKGAEREKKKKNQWVKSRESNE